MLTDTERLDAIGEYGLCVVTSDQLTAAGWERTWVCNYYKDNQDKVIFGPSIREVIDAAILDFAVINSTVQ